MKVISAYPISPISVPLLSHSFISVPDDPVTSFEEPREGLGVQAAEVVRLRVYRLVVRLEEHCKKGKTIHDLTVLDFVLDMYRAI